MGASRMHGSEGRRRHRCRSNSRCQRLSPTMEEGTLAKWLVKEGDTVQSGDILAEIETDKATMEFEAVDEGTIVQILVAEGTDGVKVGAVIAILADDRRGCVRRAAARRRGSRPRSMLTHRPQSREEEAMEPMRRRRCPRRRGRRSGQQGRGASPRTAATKRGRCMATGSRRARWRKRPRPSSRGIDLCGPDAARGPNGRIVKADLEGAKPAAAAPKEACRARSRPRRRRRPRSPPPRPPPSAKPAAAPPSASAAGHPVTRSIKLSNMRKVIARRLTESKQHGAALSI